MSQIDLKKATVYLRDGYSETGASDSTAPINIGVATVTMDGFTGAVEDGIYVMFAGDDTRYKVVSHTETLGNTTQIVITPALVEALANNTVITFGPHSLAIKNGEGTFSWTEKKTREYTLDRGLLSEVRDADQEPLEWAMDLIYEFLESESGADVPTVREAFYREGPAAAWTSSDPDTCRPYALDIVIEYDPECTDIEKEVVTIPYARFEQLDYDVSAGTIKASGKSNVEKADVQRVEVFGT
jgi:hypothetical protein